MPVTVGQHRRGQPDPVGGLAECTEGRERPHLVAQMVGHGERVEPVLLGGLREFDELTRPTLVTVALATRSEPELTGARCGLG